MQMYPGWSARDNYAQIGRKKKRPRDKNEGMEGKAISREDEVRSEKLTYHMIQMIVMIVILIEGQIT